MYQFYTNKPGRTHAFCRKIWLLMRLTTVVLIATLMQVSAASFGQLISISKEKVPLKIVLKEIRDQSGYDFVFERQSIADEIKTSINVKNATVEMALKTALSGLPFNFEISGNRVTIKKAGAPSFLDHLVARFQRIDVVGQVMDVQGKPLSGVTVRTMNSGLGAVTDSNGKFLIRGVDERDMLILSYVGYLTFQIPVKSNVGVIALQMANSKLDELQVIAYGTQSRRLGLGAVSTINAKDIENQPVTNVLAAMEGLAPGLNITPSSGAPGAAIKVQIRGQNSLSQQSSGSKPYDQPLFIVDGVPVAAQNFNINALSSFGGSDGTIGDIGGASPFNGLNPADIESISILKDITATAIYGTQGANGVILITTKKGKSGKTSVQANVNTAFSTATRGYELLNLEQYLAYRREALKNDNINLATASPTNYPDLLLFDQHKSTDWYNYFLGKSANTTDAHVSLSGGSERTTFLISTGYNNAQYSSPGNFANSRLTLHSNLNYASADNRFTLGFGYDYSYNRNNSATSPSITTGILAPPNFPDLLNEAGLPNWTYNGYNTEPFVQYAANLKQPYVLKTYNMNNSLVLGYQLIDHLKLNLNLGYSRILSDEVQKTPASTMNPNGNPASSAEFSNSIFETINIEPQLNYQRKFGLGVFSALIGGTYRKNNTSNVQLSGTQYGDEALLGSIGSAGSILATDSYNPYKYLGVFARLSYIYDEKYILQLSGRRDGSSNFGQGRQFGDFGSVSVGWIFSEENFLKDKLSVLSYGKLSGGYGTVGTDATRPYQYQQLFGTNSFLPNFQGVKPLYAQNLLNPDYGWDTKKSMNLALDLGFFEDRVLFNVNYYRDRIGNQLVNYTMPSQTGFSSVLRNFPAVVQNKGWEFSLTSKNISDTKFSWNTSFNISTNRNKLISFPGLEQSSYGMLYTVGESVNIVKGYSLKGVNPETGLFEFYKSNGAVTSNPTYGIPSQGGDYQKIANLDPKFIGGLGNTFSYKQLSLSFLFQFQKKQQANYLRSIYSGTMPGGMINQPINVLDRWTKPGDVSSIQKLTTYFSFPAYNFTSSSGAYSDGSYVRLRTASVSYTLPQGFCRKVGVSNAKFYVNGQNLFLLTNYEVGDPELASLSSFPIQRTVAFGLTLNL
ncbi:SusC/RagA family TonB-linked outer membrane protein [Pedobacter sp. MC2016-14]|uniref:SusC/RagA family TonB-linked outer membrane protein n=1 Tax=Pedobacter sp. MC2016-14 TaxID=2897327 RepID=UPI001E29A25A|nr:SusC/RagA family TonB-linked outer membrane protein [Pedobacter sp. MC2016-14]MCD0489893.1 SusC/RagA family TonB-linked outer membrane protein [Pedobacter sp. MC2016-14]